MPRPIFVALIALALTACAPVATPVSPTPAESLVPPSSTETTVSPVPPTPTPPPIIDYQRSGGFIGVKDSLTIDLSGHAKLMRRTSDLEFDLSRDELGAIQAAFDSAGFLTLPENPTPQGYAADGFVYVITYKGHQVNTGDPSVPKQLEPVVAMLNRLIDSGGK